MLCNRGFVILLNHLNILSLSLNLRFTLSAFTAAFEGAGAVKYLSHPLITLPYLKTISILHLKTRNEIYSLVSSKYEPSKL